MSSLLDARDVYATALQGISGVHVYAHGGTFDRTQIERYAREAPALVVSLLRFDADLEGGSTMAKVYWGVVGFTRSEKPGDPRDRTVIDLAEAATQVLLVTFAGMSPRSRPRGIEARNLFGVEVDRIGIAMWGLEWQQILELDQVDTSAPFTRLHADWDLSPRDNAAPLGQVLEASDDVDPPQ